MQQKEDPQIAELRSLLKTHNRIVFFGGAGVSTASGIPDFRSPAGLYGQFSSAGEPWAAFDPEELLSRDFFEQHTDWFFDYYCRAILHPEAVPNVCHLALAEWEASGRLAGVITQNIDGLHQMAGSRKVCELHGSVWRNFCVRCGQAYELSYVLEAGGVPRCSCGGVVKPAVTLYQEALSGQSLEQAADWLRTADLLFVAGTSLVVYPAAGLLRYFGGDTVAVVNLGSTALDGQATIVLQRDLAEVFGQIRQVFREDITGCE